MKSRPLPTSLALALCWLAAFAPALCAQGIPTLTTLHSFSRELGAINADGSAPASALIRGPKGNFYGTTSQEGASGLGTVFRMGPGGKVTVLHAFSGPDGSNPLGEVVRDAAGNLYGTTSGGGAQGNGTVFRLAPDGTLTTLHSFGRLTADARGDKVLNDDGAAPHGALVPGGDGSYYGTASTGGPHAAGTVYRITPDGDFALVYAFGSVADAGDSIFYDGAAPLAGVILGSDGNFYGTTSGGGAEGSGTVFRLAPDGTLATLQDFTATVGKSPVAALVQGSDGNFYGTTELGGANGSGTVFQVTADDVFTTRYEFPAYSSRPDTSQDGAHPVAALVQGSDGGFYGTTQDGGSGASGTIFRLTADGDFATLASFDYLVPNTVGGYLTGTGHNTSGAAPRSALVQGSDGNFYGTAFRGGPNDRGTLFAATPDGVLSVLHDFKTGAFSSANPDGASPTSTLVQGGDGNFYGTAPSGGSHGAGTLFQLTPAGALTVLHDFGAPGTDEGVHPGDTLISAGDGSFYGTTTSGGANQYYGTVFRFTPDGTLATLCSFTQATGHPASLTLGSDGNLYGTTTGGGVTTGDATSFRVTPAGELTVLNNQGASGSLAEGPDGNFYGTTLSTVFRQTPDGTRTTLLTIDYNAVGNSPLGGLTLGGDGNFYGVTNHGGRTGNGTVFRVTPAGVLTALYAFTDNGHPFGGVIQGSDGSLYGTTLLGGTAGHGSVYQVSPGGVGSTLVSFGTDGGGSDPGGSAPQGTLVQGSDGNFYGTTAAGGTGGEGTLFVVKSAPTVTLSATRHVISENGDLGTATVFVTRRGGDLNSPLVVSLRFLGTAANGTDYRRVRPTVTIPAGATRASFVIRPLDVGLVEGSRSVHIRVKAAADGSYAVVGSLGRVNLTINENDPVTDPPVLSSPGSVTGYAGADFSYQITATNLPDSFTATDLPAGLTFDAVAGLISGQVGQTGTYQISISASNDFGTSAATFLLTILPPP